jgi:hypothetical protein
LDGDGRNEAADFGPSAAEASVMSARGREVRRVNGRTWDGRDGAGRRVPSGLYVVRVTDSGGRVSHRKVLVVR